MDWTRAIEQERAALMRIVTLLCALAGLAELAASRSPAVRGFVLWVLRRAEAVARDFVAGGPDAQVASMPAGPAGTRPADAMRLAASLRRLARQLRRQIENQARLMLRTRGKRRAGTRPLPIGVMPFMRDAANALSMLAAFAWRTPHPAPDTS
jgi:hypothetical protein